MSRRPTVALPRLAMGALLGLAVGLLPGMATAATASPAAGVASPTLSVRVLDAALHRPSGHVTARIVIRCTGVGRADYDATVSQGRVSAQVTGTQLCNGRRHVRHVRFVASPQRFHAGNASLSYGGSVCGVSICLGFAADGWVRLR